MTAIPKWHFAMLNDSKRNTAFERAITKQIEPHHRVLDIGAGTGLLSVIVHNSGARTVDAFEAHPAMAAIASKVFEKLGPHSINLHATHSTNVQMRKDERKNFLVTEIVDCALIGEGIIPTLRHARRHLLEEVYQAIPRSAVLHGQLIESADIRSLNEVNEAAGIDVADLNALQTHGHFPVRLNTWRYDMSSEPFDILHLSLHRDPPSSDPFTVSTTATRQAVVDGIVAWFTMDLGAGETLSTAPGEESHWMQAFISFPEPMHVHPGELVEITLRIINETSLVASNVTTGSVSHCSDQSSPTLVHTGNFKGNR